MARILVTGASGYVGGRIVESLRSDGHEVVAGTRQNNLTGYTTTPFSDREQLARLCQGCDSVIHLAGSNEIDATSNPEKALADTANSTIALLDAAARAQVRKFVYFSTIHVYGAPLKGVLSETSAAWPGHSYSICHRAAEDYVLLAHRERKLSVSIARLSNSFGFPTHPEVNRWTLLVNDLCRQAATTGRIALKSSGLQYRDFIPLADVCRAIPVLLQSPDGPLPIYNLSAGRATTVLAMAQLIAQRFEVVTGRRPELTRPETQEVLQEAEFTLPCDKLLALGYEPANDIALEIDGMIERCLRWFA